MSSTPSEELISAYYDGEITPEEKEVVEEYLKKSAEADQELKEIGLLSELVQDLPAGSEKAPVEFQSAVLKQIERESLLSEVGPPASRWKRFYPYVAVVTTAACLLLMVQYFPSSDQSPEGFITDSQYPSANTEPHGEMAKPATDKTSAVRIASREKFGSVSEGSSTSRFSVSSKKNFGANKKTESSDEKALSKNVTSSNSPSNSPSDSPFRLASLDKENLNIVTVTVSNREETLKRLENLLLEQDIPKSSPQIKLKTNQSGQEKDGLVAVYVEASETQISCAIEEMQSAPRVFSCSLEPNKKSRSLETQYHSYFAQGENRPEIKGVKRKKISSRLKSPGDSDSDQGSKPSAGAPEEQEESPVSAENDRNELKRQSKKGKPKSVHSKPVPSKAGGSGGNGEQRGVKLKVAKPSPAPVASDFKQPKEESSELFAKGKDKSGKEKNSSKENIAKDEESSVKIESADQEQDFKKDSSKKESGKSVKVLTQQMRLNLPNEFLSEIVDHNQLENNSEIKIDFQNRNGKSLEKKKGSGKNIGGLDKKEIAETELSQERTRVSGNGIAGSNVKSETVDRKSIIAQSGNIRTVFVFIEAKPVLRKKAFIKPVQKKTKIQKKPAKKKSS